MTDFILDNKIFKPVRKNIHKNLANAASILGVLPVCFLFLEGGYRYLLPLIVYNNFMDDLDGILANKLGIKSAFGAALDNLCDAVAHIIFVVVVGMRFGGWCALLSLVAAGAILLRITIRLQPNAPTGMGSPTNEMVRHLFFVLILCQFFEFNPVPFLISLFSLHSFTLLIPHPMPTQIRHLVRSVPGILLLNAALIMAWFFPLTIFATGTVFLGTYLYSLSGLINTPWIKKHLYLSRFPPSQNHQQIEDTPSG